jgi:hypothetical protein
LLLSLLSLFIVVNHGIVVHTRTKVAYAQSIYLRRPLPGFLPGSFYYFGGISLDHVATARYSSGIAVVVVNSGTVAFFSSSAEAEAEAT